MITREGTASTEICHVHYSVDRFSERHRNEAIAFATVACSTSSEFRSPRAPFSTTLDQGTQHIKMPRSEIEHPMREGIFYVKNNRRGQEDQPQAERRELPRCGSFTGFDINRYIRKASQRIENRINHCLYKILPLKTATDLFTREGSVCDPHQPLPFSS